MNDEVRLAVDAIRYATLRKLASGFRHALMGDLQAIQFSAQLAARLLKTGADAGRIGEKVDALPGQCAAALATSNSMIAWLRPEEGASTTIAEGVKECVKLAGEDWTLREIAVATDLKIPDARVPRAAFQELVVVSLLVLTDTHRGPIDIDISAHEQGEFVELLLRARGADRDASFPPEIVYRPFGASDIELLSQSHGIACWCEASAVSLRFASGSDPSDRGRGA